MYLRGRSRAGSRFDPGPPLSPCHLSLDVDASAVPCPVSGGKRSAAVGDRRLDVIPPTNDGWGMPHRSLSEPEIEAVLDANRIVRVGFFAGDERYVIPLGFLWADQALWGSTSAGQKTRLASLDDRVAFVVDDGNPFGTASVVGEGRFAIVALPEVAGHLEALQARFPDNPDWNRALFVEGLAHGTSLFWRIVPSRLTGRIYHAPA